jgi:hypothetical protein
VRARRACGHTYDSFITTCFFTCSSSCWNSSSHLAPSARTFHGEHARAPETRRVIGQPLTGPRGRTKPDLQCLGMSESLFRTSPESQRQLDSALKIWRPPNRTGSDIGVVSPVFNVINAKALASPRRTHPIVRRQVASSGQRRANLPRNVLPCHCRTKKTRRPAKAGHPAGITSPHNYYSQVPCQPLSLCCTFASSLRGFFCATSEPGREFGAIPAAIFTRNHCVPR